MDKQITSLSLALEKHDGSDKFPLSPRIYDETFNFNSEPTEKVTCRMDATIQSNMQGNMASINGRSEFFSFPQPEQDLLDFDHPETLVKKVQELFHLLSNKDDNIRKQGIESLKEAIIFMVKCGYHKDNSNNHNLHNGSHSPDSPSDHQDIDMDQQQRTSNIFGSEPRQIFNQALAYLLRLSMRCPFQDVRQESKRMLQDIEDRGVRLLKPINEEISRFIPADQIQAVDKDGENDQLLSLYTESFTTNCRLPHMVMVMGIHPRYLEIFLKTNNLLLKAKGSLSKPALCYIAIMAASRHKCGYLVHLMEQQFLFEGGETSWLQRRENVPRKLQNLAKLNKFLAHAPWKVTPDVIKSLMDTPHREERWQAQDLVQVIILLSHFQSLSSFCHGTGINPELDHESGLTYSTTSYTSQDEEGENFGEKQQNLPAENATVADAEQLMERMKELDEKEEEEFSTEENRERFNFAKQEAFALTESDDMSSLSDPSTSYLSRYLDDAEFNYSLGSGNKEEKTEIFRAQDFSWEDQAYHVVSELYPEVAELLDEKFKLTMNLTYMTLATNTNVDTTALRRGIWMYVQILYNIRYDDYNYGVLSDSSNSLLERALKAFVKTLVCCPEKVSREKYDGFWKQFRHSEKVHVNIMALEARLQVGLLYGVRAFTQHYYVKR